MIWMLLCGDETNEGAVLDHEELVINHYRDVKMVYMCSLPVGEDSCLGLKHLLKEPI